MDGTNAREESADVLEQTEKRGFASALFLRPLLFRAFAFFTT
jgi:hypothetical protein